MKIHTNILYWTIIIGLVSLSTFFTYRIVTFKLSLQSGSGSLIIESGTEFVFIRTIDGDEIAVSIADQNYIIRILGIKSFDPTINDPHVSVIAKQALAYLNEQLQGKKAQLTFQEFAKDTKDRLLAYIEYNDRDIGLEMVQKGLSQVFIRYPFDRMDRYLLVEEDARSQKIGLWGDTTVADRAQKLKIKWELQRADD